MLKELTGIAIVLVTGCASAKQGQVFPFQVAEATGRTVQAGFSGAGESKVYNLKLVGVDEKKIEFDSVWVKGKYLKPRVEQIEDTTLLRFGYTQPYQPQNDTPDTVTHLPPPVDNFKGEIVIIYSTKTNQKYFPITKEIEWTNSHRP